MQEPTLKQFNEGAVHYKRSQRTEYKLYGKKSRVDYYVIFRAARTWDDPSYGNGGGDYIYYWEKVAEYQCDYVKDIKSLAAEYGKLIN